MNIFGDTIWVICAGENEKFDVKWRRLIGDILGGKIEVIIRGQVGRIWGIKTVRDGMNIFWGGGCEVSYRG